MNEQTFRRVTDEDRAELVAALRERGIGFCDIKIDFDYWIHFDFPDSYGFATPSLSTKELTLKEFTDRLGYFIDYVLVRRMELFRSVFEEWAAK